MVAVIRTALIHYQSTNPGRIHVVLGAMECKLLVPEWESERHPDLAVYLKAPAAPRSRSVWREWIPELVIEVVSTKSVDRDYVEKRDEYWSLGAKEYWIIDASLPRVTLLRRGRTRWHEAERDADGVCESKLLPGFTLPCRDIFAAAEGSIE
jgi:Uma2 family endonuclease